MVDEGTSSSLSSIKVPTFDGKKENWRFYQVKMESCLARQECVELLAWEDDIPKDKDTFDADTMSKEEIREKKLIRYQNRKAFGTVLSSILTDTDEGKATFLLVEKFVNKKEYAGGNFPKMWAAMKRRFEDTDTATSSDLKQEYYDLKMGEDELPSLFIVKCERARQKLQELEDPHEITDETFMKDILAKLPKSKDPKNQAWSIPDGTEDD